MPGQKTEVKLLHKKYILIVVFILVVCMNTDYNSIPFHPEHMSDISIFFTLVAAFVLFRVILPILLAMPFALLIAYIKRRSERRSLSRSFDNIFRNTRVRTFSSAPPLIPPIVRPTTMPRRVVTPPVREYTDIRVEDGNTMIRKMQGSEVEKKENQEKTEEKIPDLDWFDLMNDSK